MKPKYASDFVGKPYQCIENYLNLNNSSKYDGPIALVCEKNVAENHNNTEIKQGPKCMGEKDICVPKCCPLDEIFDTDKMR